MAKGRSLAGETPYVGVDIGGTKIQASLVCESGTIAGNRRCRTPPDASPKATLKAIYQTVDELLQEHGLLPDALAAMGVAVAAVVDPDQGRIVATPNMNLGGMEIVPPLAEHFGIPIALGNDTNLSTLGEKWLGAGRDADSVMGIFVGTGIGGGFVTQNGLWRGHRELGAEIGHMIMQIDGPQCGCGNCGCLEALASRTAIQRDIRDAVAAGRTTVLTEMLDGDLSIIRSGALKRALASEDELVSEVLRRAAEVLGYACLTVRHVLDPEVLVLGGGVMEACGDFMFAFVERIVSGDPYPGTPESGRIVLSALGDDAGVLGAVALAREHIGRSPFGKPLAAGVASPSIHGCDFGQITVGTDTYNRDVYIRANGKVKARKKKLAKRLYGDSHVIGPEEAAKVCKGAPEVLFVGAGHSNCVELNAEAEQYLRRRGVTCQVLPTPQAVDAYNACRQRKAALIHVTC